MNQFVWVVLAVIFAVLLDLYIVRRWRHYRLIRQDDWTFREKVKAWFEHPIDTGSDQNIVTRFRETLASIWEREITKIVTFFSGVSLVVTGQYLMSRTEPIEALIITSQKINEHFRIDVDNLDNVIAGLPLILLGGILFALSTRTIVFRGDADTSLKNRSKHSIPKKSKLWFACITVGGGLLIFLLIRLFLVQANRIDTIAWIISIGAFLIAALWWDRAASISLKIKLSASEVIQLMLIVALGLIVGVYQLQNVPNLLMGDEGSFLETARSIALGTYQPSPFELGVYSYPILSSFWQAGILKLFGVSLWGWRFASVLPAVLAVIPLYLLSRDLFGRSVGVVSALVLIVSPYFLAFSRLGYNNSQSILVVTLCVWLVYFGAKKSSVFYSFLGGAAAGLGFLTYTAGRLGLVVAGLFFAVLFLAKSSQANKKQYLFSLFLPFTIGLVVFASPYTIYNQQNAPEESRFKMLEGLLSQVNYGLDYYEEDELFQHASPMGFDEHEFFYNPQIYAELLVRGVARTLLAFHHEGLVSEHFVSDTLAGPFATIFYTLGGFFVFGQLRDRRFLLLAMWFASGLFFLSMINTYPPRHQHLVPVIPVMAIMIGLGVVAFSKQIAAFFTSEQKTKQIFQISLTTVIVISIGVIGLREYFVVMPTIYRPHLEQVMNWFGLYNSPEIDFVLIHTEPVHEEWRPYLFRDLLGEHKFALVDADEFLASENNLITGSNVAIFYTPDQTEKITNKLLLAFPNAQEIIYFNREQKPIAEAIIQGDITVPASASLIQGLLNVFSSPAMWLLIPLFLFVGYYWIKHKDDLAISPEIGILDDHDNQALTDEPKAKTADELPETKKQPILKIEKGPGFFEIGFFFQFASKDTIRHCEPKFSVQFSKEKKSTDTPEDES